MLAKQLLPRSCWSVPAVLQCAIGLLALLITGPAMAASASPRTFILCVLDQPVLLQKSRLATDKAARFQQLRQQAQARLDEDRRILDSDQQAFNVLRPSLSPAVAVTREQEIEGRRNEIALRAEQLNSKLNQLDIELTNMVMKAATPHIIAIQNEKGCSVLMARSTFLTVNDPELDITADLIARMNAALGSATTR